MSVVTCLLIPVYMGPWTPRNMRRGTPLLLMACGLRPHALLPNPDTLSGHGSWNCLKMFKLVQNKLHTKGTPPLHPGYVQTCSLCNLYSECQKGGRLAFDANTFFFAIKIQWGKPESNIKHCLSFDSLQSVCRKRTDNKNVAHWV